MSRISLYACAAFFLMSGGATSVAAEETTTAPTASGRRIALAMPRPKADKTSAAVMPDIVKWTDDNGANPGPLTAPTPEKVRQALKQGTEALEAARVESCKKFTELMVWISTTLKVDPTPRVTPVSSPRRLPAQKLAPVPEPNPGDGVKQYVGPEGRLQTVTGR